MTAQHLAILGGGQLAAMLADAAKLLDIPVRIVTTAASDACLNNHWAAHTQVFSDWQAALDSVADNARGITWEREDIPLPILRQQACTPAASVLARTQDRQDQKQLFDDLELPHAKWLSVQAGDEQSIIDTLGLPVMIKARVGGFDGRGQVIVRDAAALPAALQRYAKTGAIAEQLINFDDEFAILACRNRQGQVKTYPLTKTHQSSGQLAWSLAPHPQLDVHDWANDVAQKLTTELDHVGVLAIECFRQGHNVMLNEIAPRVHNSGHWTIEGAMCSQFENHVRAVCDLDLGDTSAKGHSLLINCIGEMPDPADCGRMYRHDYCKSPRPGRKLGHCNLNAADLSSLQEEWQQLPAQWHDLQPFTDTKSAKA